ncbi:MAG: NAD(P)H-hydrate dehydratase, partial [Holophaga sp.]|nr:NAD(P)H-hydrate dehydratase [Holophaga sp.]
IPLLDAVEMRVLETEAISQWGISSQILQEHAALGALALLPPGEPLHILAGPGNNGGDALALARLARLRGERVEVWALNPEPVWTGDAAVQAALWEGLGGNYRYSAEPQTVLEGLRGWVVDGLFGLGVRLPLEGLASAWAQGINSAITTGKAGFKVMALDLPSGLDPSCADVVGVPIVAHRTACFGHLKICHGLWPAREFCGEIVVIPIPLRAPVQASVWKLESPKIGQTTPWNTYKHQRGHVAIRAGSLGMSGAAVLAAHGALRMGAGLVTVLADAELRSEIATQVPEAMVRVWEGAIPDGVDALLVGPGGVCDIPEWQGPLVLDASALRHGEGMHWMARPDTVITPHPAEFARLFNLSEPLTGSTDERLREARSVATGLGVLVLKGAQTIIAGGGTTQLWVNPTGHPGLSTGGTGDFLAGMVVAKMAMWARQSHPLRSPIHLRQAVAEAVWLHGAAADRLGSGPLLVRELGVSLAALLREPDEH